MPWAGHHQCGHSRRCCRGAAAGRDRGFATGGRLRFGQRRRQALRLPAELRSLQLLQAETRRASTRRGAAASHRLYSSLLDSYRGKKAVEEDRARSYIDMGTGGNEARGAGRRRRPRAPRAGFRREQRRQTVGTTLSGEKRERCSANGGKKYRTHGAAPAWRGRHWPCKNTKCPGSMGARKRQAAGECGESTWQGQARREKGRKFEVQREKINERGTRRQRLRWRGSAAAAGPAAAEGPCSSNRCGGAAGATTSHWDSAACSACSTRTCRGGRSGAQREAGQRRAHCLGSPGRARRGAPWQRNAAARSRTLEPHYTGRRQGAAASLPPSPRSPNPKP